jgi:hypothetical protein
VVSPLFVFEPLYAVVNAMKLVVGAVIILNPFKQV